MAPPTLGEDVAPLAPVMADLDLAAGAGGYLPGSVTGLASAAAGVEAALDTFDVSELERRPEVVAQVAPVYPAELRKAKVEGSVTVVFLLTEEGRVEEAQGSGFVAHRVREARTGCRPTLAIQAGHEGRQCREDPHATADPVPGHSILIRSASAAFSLYAIQPSCPRLVRRSGASAAREPSPRRVVPAEVRHPPTPLRSPRWPPPRPSSRRCRPIMSSRESGTTPISRVGFWAAMDFCRRPSRGSPRRSRRFTGTRSFRCCARTRAKP